MLTLTFKIINKLMANRMKKVDPFLVDKQQIGFIKGRGILDNILAFKIGQDYCKCLKILGVALMIDFARAYDRVSHVFLEDTMRCMWFLEKFIALVLGLIQQTASKVHQNGYFTKEISIDRGVWQGCPLAP